MEEPSSSRGGERRSLGGRIPQEVQQQARQRESPVVSELLTAARKGLTDRVAQLLQQDPANAATTDKVNIEYALAEHLQGTIAVAKRICCSQQFTSQL